MVLSYTDNWHVQNVNPSLLDSCVIVENISFGRRAACAPHYLKLSFILLFIYSTEIHGEYTACEELS